MPRYRQVGLLGEAIPPVVSRVVRGRPQNRPSDARGYPVRGMGGLDAIGDIAQTKRGIDMGRRRVDISLAKARQYMANGDTMTGAARKLGISHGTLKKRLAQAESSSCPSGPPANEWADHWLSDALARVQAGESEAAVLRDYGYLPAVCIRCASSLEVLQ